MSYQLWKLANGQATCVGDREDRADLDPLVHKLPATTPVAFAREGVVLGGRASEAQLKLFRAAIAATWRAAGGAPPAPLPTPTEEPITKRHGTPITFGRGKRREEAPVAPKPAATLTRRPTTSPATTEALRCPATGCERPSASWGVSLAPALRPLCLSHRAMAHRAARVDGLDVDAAAAKVLDGAARRRGAQVASEPEVAPADTAPAAEPEGEPASAQLLRERADGAEAKIVRLQRLLDQVSRERDAHRDRVEQLAAERDRARGEVEGLTTDLGVTKRDLATTVQQLNELSDRTRSEIAQITTARDEARELLSLALSSGLAAAEEARAETARVLRQSGELSRQLAAARDELAALRAAPAAAPALDEVTLERVAQRAARRALSLQGEAGRLARLAQEHGGVEAIVRIVEGAMALRKAVG